MDDARKTGETHLWDWQPDGAPVPLLLFLVLVLAAVLRISHLGSQGLSHDELCTVAESAMSPAQVLAHLETDRHPPLYLLMIHLTVTPATSEFAVRLPSAIAGVATCAVLYAVAAWLVTPTYGLLVSLLVAVSPFHVWASQQARSYSLFGLEVALSLLAAVMLVRHLRSPAGWVLYGTGALLQIYTFYYGFFIVGALGSYLALLALRRWRGLGPWLVVHLLIALLYLPWVPSLMHQMGNRSNRLLQERASTTATRLAEALQVATTSMDPSWTLQLHEETRWVPVVPGLTAVTLGILLAGTFWFWRVKMRAGDGWGLIPWTWGVGFALAVIGSVVSSPDLVAWRYVLAFGLLGQFLLAGAIMLPNRVWVAALLLIGLLRWELQLIQSLHRTPRDEYREAAAHFLLHRREGDVILFSRPSHKWIGRFYFRETPGQLAPAMGRGDGNAETDVNDVFFPLQQGHLNSLRLPEDDGSRIWVLYNFDQSRSQTEADQDLMARHLASKGFELGDRREMAGIVLEVHRRRSGPTGPAIAPPPLRPDDLPDGPEQTGSQTSDSGTGSDEERQVPRR